MYVLQKNHVIEPLFDRAAAEPALARSLGLNASAVRRRAHELDVTRREVDPARRASNGIADWLFPPFSSWVRFDFDSPDASGSLPARAHPARDGAAPSAPAASSAAGGWRGCRRLRAGGCEGTQLRSDDPSLFPPLSRAEIVYQCGAPARAHAGALSADAVAPGVSASSRAPASCRLRWQPGSSCYTILDTPIGDVAGFAARAASLGVSTAAGPSGTTANTLQLAQLLGATGDELVLLRLAMVVWLVLSRDHTLWEVMLGAEPFLTPALRIGELPDGQPAVCALGRLLPPVLEWRGHSVRSADAWASAVTTLRATPAWHGLGKARRAYFSCLAHEADPAACCAGPRLRALVIEAERHASIDAGRPDGGRDRNGPAYPPARPAAPDGALTS